MAEYRAIPPYRGKGTLIGRPKKKFTEDQKAHIFHLYQFTSCSIARIARHFDCSPGPINIVIEEMEKRERD